MHYVQCWYKPLSVQPFYPELMVCHWPDYWVYLMVYNNQWGNGCSFRYIVYNYNYIYIYLYIHIYIYIYIYAVVFFTEACVPCSKVALHPHIGGRGWSPSAPFRVPRIRLARAAGVPVLMVARTGGASQSEYDA